MTMNARRSLSRRTLLRGAGNVAIALPWLQIMRPSRALGAPGDGPARRFVTWFWANGSVTDAWTCTGTGTDFALSRILEPLQRHKKDLLVLQGMSLAGEGYAHWHATTHELTGRTHVKGKAVAETAAHITADQEIARQYGNRTRFGSLQLGVKAGVDNDHGIATVSYLGPDRPLFMQDNPYEAARALFSDSNRAPAELERFRALERSLLDSVGENARLLEKQLGKEDRQRLDAHLTSIRELEMRLDAVAPAGAGCAPIEPPLTRLDHRSTANVPAIGALQMDVLAQAFACDLTRVATFMWAACFGSGRNHAWIPDCSGDHHQLSHSAAGGDAAAKEKMVKITRWYQEQLASLIDRLKALPEGGGTVFDNTVIWSTSEFGYNHYHRDMPFTLAGSCGGFFKTGRLLKFTRETTHNGILVGVLQAMGLPLDQWGDPKYPAGILPGLRG